MDRYIPFILALIVALSAKPGFSQDTTYYDSTKSNKVLSRDKAKYYEIVEHQDASRKTINLYTIEGTKVAETSYLKFNTPPASSMNFAKSHSNQKGYMLDGAKTEWHENGNLKSEEIYANGLITGVKKQWYGDGKPYYEVNFKDDLMEGDFLVWWESGKPKRTAKYADNELVAGECFDEKGNPVDYYEFWVQPDYPGGINEARKFVGQNFNYPSSAIRSGVNGTVEVKFVVEKDGSLSEVGISKSMTEDIDKEAIRTVKKLKKWKPGAMDGKPVRVLYALPIRLVLSN
ncbi:energy transducer TonB [Sphingobacterium hungaricum]|nr:energy transducer TonB [Sphingobacterium hungaricum]